MLAPKVLLATVFALGAAADNCYWCAYPSYTNPQYPTYDCGKKCGYKHYSTSEPNWKCWASTHEMNSCFKKCCEKAGKEAVKGKCTVLGNCW